MILRTHDLVLWSYEVVYNAYKESRSKLLAHKEFGTSGNKKILIFYLHSIAIINFITLFKFSRALISLDERWLLIIEDL